MKKTVTITAVAFLAISVVSCSKTSSEISKQELLKISSAHPSTEINVISNWIYPASFSVETDRLGNLFIKGLHPFTASTQLSYDESAHVELVYTRIPTNQRTPYTYKRLAFDFRVDPGGNSAHVFLDFSLDHGGLSLYFRNADYATLSRAVDQTASENWNFRYIVLPKTKYQSTNVDWDDLSAVAAVLNFPL